MIFNLCIGTITAGGNTLFVGVKVVKQDENVIKPPLYYFAIFIGTAPCPMFRSIHVAAGTAGVCVMEILIGI